MVMAIVQARMSSRRFPGKMLAELVDRSILQHVIERLHDAFEVSHIVVATPANECPRLRRACEDLYVTTIAPLVGEDDVLGRFVRVLDVCSVRDAMPVIRVCGDNPLLWPHGIDALVEAYVPEVDYVGYWCNTEPMIRRPTGYFAELVRAAAVRRLNGELPEDAVSRQHVTEGLYHPLSGYVCRWLQPPRWYDAAVENAAVDTPKDLCRVKSMIQEDRVPWRN